MATFNTIQTEFAADGTRNIDMWAVGAAGRATMHSLTVVGSGAVTGTLNIFRGRKITVGTTETIYYDTTAAATISVTGTNLASESESFEVAGCEYWSGVLSGLSGSSNAYWAICYADRP
jgi:hypothetical protein